MRVAAGVTWPAITAAARSATAAVIGTLPVTLYIAGAAVFSYGVWLAWHPAGFMFAGGVMVNAGLKLGAVGGRVAGGR